MRKYEEEREREREREMNLCGLTLSACVQFMVDYLHNIRPKKEKN